MPDEMDNYQNFHDICTIAKVEMESSTVMLDERNGGTAGNVDSTSSASRLPPGFRFHPTDEELVSYYLKKKVENNHYNFEAIDEVNLNRCEPWDLPAKAKVGENAWYFFSLRDRKYPTGMRTNRATDAGYWKATGKDREVMSSDTNRLVGMKKTLVFYLGRAPKGEKTNWIMHEYRIEGESSPVTEWVVCRVFKKNAALRKSAEGHDHPGGTNYQLELEDNESSFDHQSSTYLPPLITDSPNHHQSQSTHVLSSTHASAGFSTPPSSSVDYRQQQQQQHHQAGAGAGAGGAYQNEHELQQLQSSRTFNMNDFTGNFSNANWAIRRENLMHIQGVANTIESLVSGLSGSWDTVVPIMPSTNDSDWPIWDSPSR